MPASQSASQQQQQQQRLVQGVAGPTPSYGQPLSSVSCSTQQNRTKRKFEKIQKAKQRKKFLQRIAAALSLSGSPSSFSFFLSQLLYRSVSVSRSVFPSHHPYSRTDQLQNIWKSKVHEGKNPKQAFFLTPSQRQRSQ